MSTPHGMRCTPKPLASGDKVLLYSDTQHILLQLRHQVPSEETLLEPSFKVAVSLTPAEAIALASELLTVALPQLGQILTTGHEAQNRNLPLPGAEALICALPRRFAGLTHRSISGKP